MACFMEISPKLIFNFENVPTVIRFHKPFKILHPYSRRHWPKTADTIGKALPMLAPAPQPKGASGRNTAYWRDDRVKKNYSDL